MYHYAEARCGCVRLSGQDDFISISGSKMRTLARNGATPCPVPMPTDVVAANCVQPGFMVGARTGWIPDEGAAGAFYKDVPCSIKPCKDAKRQALGFT